MLGLKEGENKKWEEIKNRPPDRKSMCLRTHRFIKFKRDADSQSFGDDARKGSWDV